MNHTHDSLICLVELIDGLEPLSVEQSISAQFVETTLKGHSRLS